jgi:hypothetical protein
MVNGADAKKAAERAFLRSERVQGLLHPSVLGQSICIADLECVNSLIKRISQMGRAPKFSTKAATIYLNEVRIVFRQVFGYDPPDAMEELFAEVEKEVDACKKLSGKRRVSRDCRGFDEFVRQGSDRINETTNVESTRDTSSHEHGGRGNLVHGASDSHRLLSRAWQEMGWAGKAMAADAARDRQSAEAALAIRRQPLAAGRAAVQKDSCALAAWMPPQQPLFGNDRYLVTESEYKGELLAIIYGMNQTS